MLFAHIANRVGFFNAVNRAQFAGLCDGNAFRGHRMYAAICLSGDETVKGVGLDLCGRAIHWQKLRPAGKERNAGTFVFVDMGLVMANHPAIGRYKGG